MTSAAAAAAASVKPSSPLVLMTQWSMGDLRVIGLLCRPIIAYPAVTKRQLLALERPTHTARHVDYLISLLHGAISCGRCRVQPRMTFYDDGKRRCPVGYGVLCATKMDRCELLRQKAGDKAAFSPRPRQLGLIHR